MFFHKRVPWNSWGVSTEQEKFFIRRWEELFTEDTLDSWQVRYSNVMTILHEILNCLPAIKRVPAHHINIDILLDEVKYIAASDVVIKEHFPLVGKLLDNLKLEYSNNIRDNKTQKIEAFSSAVKILISSLDNYGYILFAEIEREMSKGASEYTKSNLNCLISQMATYVTSVGFSIPFLRDEAGILKDSSETNFMDKFKKLLVRLKEPENNYECRFHVSWSGDFPNLADGNIKFEEEIPSTTLTQDESEFYNQDKITKIAVVSTSARDHHQARSQAEDVLERFFSISKLFLISKNLIVKHDVCLICDKDNRKYTAKSDSSRLGYMKNDSKPLFGIEGVLKTLNRLDKKDIGCLSSSLTYHKLALKADNDESRLINLWISMESLIQNEKRNIIDKICEFVPPSITTNYVYRIVKSIPISMMDIWRKSNTEGLRKHLSSKSTKYILHPLDLVKVLRDEKDGPMIESFYKLVAHDPMLTYRIYEIRKAFTSNGDEGIAKRVERHQKNVLWQVRRIYRARNHIVHSGSINIGLRQLVQHLHTYYLSSIRNLLHDLQYSNDSGIRDALERRKRVMELYIDNLKENIISVPDRILVNPGELLQVRRG